jgi:hypothetical protein
LAADQLATLQGAREHPYVVDDLTVARVTATFTRTRTDLVTLFAEQGAAGRPLALGATRRCDLDTRPPLPVERPHPVRSPARRPGRC